MSRENSRALALLAGGVLLCSAVCLGDVPELLARAKDGPLGPAHWKELIGALADPGQSDRWAEIADLLGANRSNWDADSLARTLETRWLTPAGGLEKLPFATLDALWGVCRKLDLQAVSLKVALSWMKASDQWKTLDPSDSVQLLEGILKQPSPEAEAARKTLAEALYRRYLAPETVSGPATLPERTHILKNITPLLSDAQKRQLQTTLAELFKDPGRVRDVSVFDFRDLRRDLTQMDAEEFFVVRCCAPWVIFSPNATKMSSSRDRLWINERLDRYAGRHSDLQVIEALAHSFAQAGEKQKAEHWTKEAIRLFGKAEDPAASDPATIAAITRILGTVQLGDRELDLRWRWAVLLHQVLAGPANERPARWRSSMERFDRKGLPELTARNLEDLKVFLGRLGKEGTLAPGVVLNDLAALTEDEVLAKPRLREMANQQDLLRLSDSNPPEVRALLKAGQEAARNGQADAAVAAYSEALDKSANAETTKAVRRVLLPLLLDQGLRHLVAAAEVWGALRPKEGPWPADIWNGGLRLAFRQVTAAEPDKRKDVWAERMKVMVGGDGGFSEATLEDLDRFVKALGEVGSFGGEEVLTDLILCTSDVPSMRAVLRRRVTILLEGKRWPAAVASSALDVHLATAGEEGPWGAFARWKEAMASAGVPEREASRFLDLVMPGGRSAKSAEPPSPGGSLRDESLRQAAKKLYQTSGTSLPLRRRRWVRLFAGEHEAALEDFHSCLRTCGAGSRTVLPEMASVCLAAGLAEGHLGSGWRFCRQVAAGKRAPTAPAGVLDILMRREAQLPTKPPAEAGDARKYGELPAEARAKLASEALLRQRQRTIRWGWQAVAAGDEQWGGRLWASALALADEKDAASTLEELSVQAGRVTGQVLAGTFRSMADGMQERPLKRQTLLRLAGMLCERRMFPEGLKALDEADALARTPDEAKDLDAGMVRVACLIKLSRSEQALELLKAMDTWSGTEEQHAQAGFLLGWMHLQGGRQDQAVEAFRALIKKYPKTAFAGKAKQVLDRLNPKS